MIGPRAFEIAVRQGLKIASVLDPYRLIQSIRALQVVFNFGSQRLFLIERPAGRGMHQKKCSCYDNQQRGNSGGQPQKKVADHRISLSADREVDKRSVAP